jgi:hypothetical protein
MCGGGIIIGILALVGLTKLVGFAVCRARGHHRGGCGRGGYGRRCHGGGHHHGRGRWRDHEEDGGPGYFLRWIFERLDATPGQEKVIREAFEEIRNAVREAKVDFRKSRSKVADALRNDEFGHDDIGEAWVGQDGLLEKVRLKISSALQRVHEALDEKQRKILADLIERGPRFGGFGWARGDGHEPDSGEEVLT